MPKGMGIRAGFPLVQYLPRPGLERRHSDFGPDEPQSGGFAPIPDIWSFGGNHSASKADMATNAIASIDCSNLSLRFGYGKAGNNHHPSP